jgi:hypothetical protein
MKESIECSLSIFINMRLFLLLLLMPFTSSGQIRIDKAGDGWDLKIDSALTVIKQTDPQKFQLLDSVCQEVSFWISNFSSNELVGKTGRIYVSTKDIKLGINNLACVLIHESLHLYFLRKGVKMTPAEEENYCYRYELEFIEKLTNPEPWLKENALKHIQ